MKRYLVLPFVGIGPVKLGAERAEVRKIAHDKFDAFAPNVDAFDELGIHCHYDPTDHVEFIEAFEPASPTIDGLEVLGEALGEIMDELKSRGFQLTQALTDSVFPADGVAFTLGDNKLVEAVAVFRRGYYDHVCE